MWPDRGGAHLQDVVFPPLAPDARSAELLIPSLIVEEDAPEVTVSVPIAGARIGEVIPLNAALQLGPYPFRVPSARIVEQWGERMLALDLDLGDWDSGRMLVGIGRVWVQGEDRGFQARSDGEVGQWSDIRVSMPESEPSPVVVTLRQARVAIDGPWRLEVPLHHESDQARAL
jgi:hypothetical protein